MIRAGSLDRTIVVGRVSNVVTDDGTPVPTWTDVAVLRAQLLTNTADDTAHESGAVTTTTRTFRTRWADVLVGDRVTYAGTQYEVVEVVEIGRREGLDLRCLKRGQ